MAATTKIIDMTNVKERGNFNPRHKTPGDYRAKVVKVEDHQAKDSAVVDQWVFTVALVGDMRATYGYYVGWDPKFAWKSRGLLVAAGLMAPDKKARVKVDPNKLVGKEIGITLDDDEYEGRMKSTIVSVFPTSELTESADDADGTDAGDDADPDADLDLEDI